MAAAKAIAVFSRSTAKELFQVAVGIRKSPQIDHI